MKTIKLLLLLFILNFFVVGCGAKKKNISKSVASKPSKSIEVIKEEKSNNDKEVVRSNTDIRTEEYIKHYADIALIEMKDHKIPASITLAQGILESNSGNSSLTRVSNNHFGIKCHKNWQGSKTYYDDDKKGECFRVYKEPKHSFDDHSEFLSSRKRYAALFKLDLLDYKAWARGLRAAGYATDKKYPQKLIRIIEKYKLYKYDSLGLPDSYKRKYPRENYYIVQKGDALYGIAKKYNLSVDELKRLNDLSSNTLLAGQKLRIRSVDKTVSKTIQSIQITQDTIPPKKKIVSKAKIERDTIQQVVVIDTTKISQKDTELLKIPDYHVVKKGETLYTIAYKYQLEIPDIRKWNNIKKNEIAIGQKILLKDPNILKDTKLVVLNNKHIVTKGETLFSIAKMYHISLEKLKYINHLKNNIIVIGQELLVK